MKFVMWRVKSFHCRIRRNKILYSLIILITTLVITVILLYNVVSKLDGRKNDTGRPAHKLCIIVPFRNRFEELLQFIPYIHHFLNRQNVIHEIYIINQIDEYRFNRASLINVGYLYVTFNSSQCDYIAMHDVDLLPINDTLSYEYPADGSFHVSAPHIHPKYHYSTFIGGILLITTNDFKLVNGMSNKYWGWGLEDDEFYLRLKEANVKINRPENVLTNDFPNTKQSFFRHIHGKNRKRDMGKCFNQKEATRKRDRITGLNDVRYSIHSTHYMSINHVFFTIINVALHCNQTATPWCSCSNKPQLKTVQ